MPITEGFHAELQGIAKIIANDQIRVQHSQRPYAWRDENVGDLYDDLESAVKSNADIYYLGTILLRVAADGILEAIDGQQRLATTVIFLAAIRDHLKSAGIDEVSRGIGETYLAKPDMWTQVPTPRLQLGATDHEYYMKSIICPDGRQLYGPQRPSHRRLKIASDKATAYVARIVANEPDPVAALKKRVDYLDSSAKALVFRMPESVNPYTVFETINARGLSLNDTEKLKNHIFGLAGSRLSEAELDWSKMSGIIEAVDPERAEDNELSFIRHLESSRHGVTRRADLYRQVTKRVTTQSHAIEFSDDLSKSAVRYAAILSPSPDRWMNLGTRAQSYCADLNDMGMIQVRPVLLAILVRLPANAVEAAISVVVSSVVRLLEAIS